MCRIVNVWPTGLGTKLDEYLWKLWWLLKPTIEAVS